MIKRHEGELIQIAFLIATGVLHREIETNDETILAVAQAALAKVVKANHVLLKVSPYDLEMVQRLMSDTDAPPDWLPPTVKLEADMSIGRGGCKVVTDSGEIDATIETQLHLIKAIAWSA